MKLTTKLKAITVSVLIAIASVANSTPPHIMNDKDYKEVQRAYQDFTRIDMLKTAAKLMIRPTSESWDTKDEMFKLSTIKASRYGLTFDYVRVYADTLNPKPVSSPNWVESSSSIPYAKVATYRIQRHIINYICSTPSLRAVLDFGLEYDVNYGTGEQSGRVKVTEKDCKE